MKLALRDSLSSSSFLNAILGSYWQSAVRLPCQCSRSVHYYTSCVPQKHNFPKYTIHTSENEVKAGPCQSPLSKISPSMIIRECEPKCSQSSESVFHPSHTSADPLLSFSDGETPRLTSLSFALTNTYLFVGSKPAPCYLSVRHIFYPPQDFSTRADSFSRCSQKAEIYEGFSKACRGELRTLAGQTRGE